MKTLLTKMSLTVAIALITSPLLSHASIRITNNLDQTIKFAIYQGDVIIDRNDHMNGHMNYQRIQPLKLNLYATVKVADKISNSQSYALDLQNSADYTAVVQAHEGTSEFRLQENEATALGALNLNNNLNQEVLFTIRDNEQELQKLVIPAYSQKQLSLEKKYKVLIVANGVTLDPILTTNPNLTITVSASKDQNGNDVYTAKY